MDDLRCKIISKAEVVQDTFLMPVLYKEFICWWLY